MLGCDERTHVDCWVSVLFQVSANLWLTSNRQDPSTRLTSGHSLANADQLIHLPKRRHGCRTSRTTITPAGNTLKLDSLILHMNVESQILFLRYESKLTTRFYAYMMDVPSVMFTLTCIHSEDHIGLRNNSPQTSVTEVKHQGRVRHSLTRGAATSQLQRLLMADPRRAPPLPPPPPPLPLQTYVRKCTDVRCYISGRKRVTADTAACSQRPDCWDH